MGGYEEILSGAISDPLLWISLLKKDKDFMEEYKIYINYTPMLGSSFESKLQIVEPSLNMRQLRPGFCGLLGLNEVKKI